MTAKVRDLRKLAILLLFLTGCSIPMISFALFGNGDKFDWLATESAPADYPMEVISGNLRYHNDPKGRGLYVPARSIIFQGWGNGVSTHITGEDLKPLPDQLDITFFSYTENTFYADGTSYDRSNGMRQIIATRDGGYILLSSQTMEAMPIS